MSITQKITDLAYKIIIAETIELDKEHIREDLSGLYSDIIIELSLKAPGKENLIYDYASLMDKEQEMYSPQLAYEAGAILGCFSARNRDHALLSYIRKLYMDEEIIQILNKRDNMFFEISKLLGDTCGLIKDFHDLYCKFYGVIGRKIGLFFFMGYDSTYKEMIA